MSSLITSFVSNDEERNLHKILNKESGYYLEVFFLHEKNRLQKKDFHLRCNVSRILICPVISAQNLFYMIWS